MEIIDFLPIYPLIGNTESQYNKFYKTLFRKKEFYELKLPPSEERPEVPGQYLLHQQFMSRFVSPYTPYNRMLAFHQVGTGKTCLSIAVAEHLKTQSINPNKALILVKGPVIRENFKEQLTFHCTNRIYIPEGYDDLSKEKKARRLNDMIKQYYEINTFETFAKQIQNMEGNEEILKRNYSNRLIIIDEAHNLHIQPDDKKKKDKLRIYQQLHKFLHLVEGARILLLTATPMINDPAEIASLMNLLLPMSKQLPVLESFEGRYYRDGRLIRGDELKNYFVGMVSYIRMLPGAVREDIGQSAPWFDPRGGNGFKVVPCGMSSHQLRGYREAVSRDSRGDGDDEDVPLGTERITSAFRINSRHASNFVFEDGTYGTAGFLKNMPDPEVGKGKKKSKKGDEQKTGKKGKKEIKNILKRKLLGSTRAALLSASAGEDRLVALSKYSCKFADIIRTLLENPKELAFVYSEFVTGSGAVLFGDILRYFGFSKATGKETTRGKRYAIIIGQTSKSERQDIQRLFKSPENRNGKYIQVLIGSRVLGEGFSLYNIRQVHVLTPHWNNSSTEQAIGRAFRSFSHTALAPSKRIVKVYRHAAVIEKKGKFLPLETIDISLYKLSEDKDLRIKMIERLLKEISVDCALNYERNVLPTDKDGSRECDYEICKYVCDHIPSRWFTGSGYDVSEEKLVKDTYELYYSDSVVEEIALEIQALFREYFVLSIAQIIERLTKDDYEPNLVLKSLDKIIEDKVQMRDRYGFQAYLKEQDNSYFLVRSSVDDSDSLMTYYSQHPAIRDAPPFSDFTVLFRLDLDKKRIIRFKHLDPATDANEIKPLLKNLSNRVKLILIETALTAKAAREGNDVQKRRQKFVLKYFKSNIFKLPGVIVTNILGSSKDLLRCMPEEKERFEDCEAYPNVEKNIKQKIEDRFAEIEEDNEYRMYGLVDRASGGLWIRDLENPKSTKKGQKCNSYGKPFLMSFLMRTDVAPPRMTRLSDRTRLKSYISHTSKIGEAINLATLDDVSTEDLRRMVSWLEVSRDKLCLELKKFLTSEGLVIPK